MKVFVAGASGVIGQSLIPLLVQEGHQVYGSTRSVPRMEALSRLGAEPVLLDVFDREAGFAMLQEVKPDVVIHQLTSLSDRDFDEHARIRREGTRNLVDASLHAGVKRMIAQSISWAYEGGEQPATEEEPLDLQAAQPRLATVEAVDVLETAVREMPEHVILRYGLFYGAGTWYAPEGWMAELARQRQLPATDGVASFIHVEDAALAAVHALRWPSGCYNIVDHEPAAGTEWLSSFAQAVGAPVPEVKPGRAEWERGASNAKALRLGWQPRYGTWREGFRSMMK